MISSAAHFFNRLQRSSGCRVEKPAQPKDSSKGHDSSYSIDSSEVVGVMRAEFGRKRHSSFEVGLRRGLISTHVVRDTYHPLGPDEARRVCDRLCYAPSAFDSCPCALKVTLSDEEEI